MVTRIFAVLSQEIDGFIDCPSCEMHDWSHSQQVEALISMFSEVHPFVGIYSEMAEVSTCPAKDWSSAHQLADLLNLLVFPRVVAEASTILMLVPIRSVSVDLPVSQIAALHIFCIKITVVSNAQSTKKYIPESAEE